MKIRAAVLRQMGLKAPYAESRPLTIETLELAPPQAGELLVRVLAAGICHSDLSVVDGVRPRPMPMALGHEASGEVIELGPGVKDFAVGDRIVFSYMPSCGHCDPCAGGRPALCEPGAKANGAGELLEGGRRLRDASGAEVSHHLGVSGFADHVVVSERSAVKVSKNVAPEIAALFGCAVMTGVGAIVNTAKVAAGESVAVFGLGGVGLAALMGARAAGAYPIVAVDINEQKLKLAAELGAHLSVDGRDTDAIDRIRAFTHGGVQVAVESVGSERVFSQAYAVTRRGGTTVGVGLPPPDRMLSVPAVSLVAEERTIKGSYMGSAVPSRDLPRYVAMYQAGLLPVDRLLTHTLKLEDINEGFDRLAKGEAIRQVIVF